MSTQTINGLHTCKRGNEPRVGDVKTLVIENKTGKSGKPYLKIKSAGPEYGGTPHRIISAEKTDFVDSHGNLSFNLEVEPVSETPASQPTTQHQPARQPQPRQQASSGDPVEVFQDELAKVNNALFLICKGVDNLRDQLRVSNLEITPEQYQAMVSTAFINLKDYVPSLPTTPVWSAR